MKRGLSFTGELCDVRLFNFSIAMGEARLYVPAPLVVRNVRGRAIVSVVDVRLERLRVRGLPWFPVSYRHIAVRILLDDSAYTGGTARGACILFSPVVQPCIQVAGNLLTEFRFMTARVVRRENCLSVEWNGMPTVCKWDENAPTVIDDELEAAVRSVDRAYSVHGARVVCRSIARDHWNIRPLACRECSCSWFNTARFEGAFCVPERVHYTWFAPQEVFP